LASGRFAAFIIDMSKGWVDSIYRDRLCQEPSQYGIQAFYVLLLGLALRLEKFCAWGTFALCRRMCQRVLQKSISPT